MTVVPFQPGFLCRTFCLKPNDSEAWTPAFLLPRLPGVAPHPAARGRGPGFQAPVHTAHGLPFAFGALGVTLLWKERLSHLPVRIKPSSWRLSYVLLYFCASSSC